MTLYVDDMILSGPRQEVERLWTKIEEQFEIDPPTAVDRILGRKHVYDHFEGKTTIFYDMVDFCRMSCNLYVGLSKSSKKLPLLLCQTVRL